MRVNLPTDLLRSFVTIVDTGSMVRASEHIFLTQSALSLQMKRLAEILQQPLFRRQQNAMILTPTGEMLLPMAREILTLNDSVIAAIGGRMSEPLRIGMVQDFADAILAKVLSRFRRANTDVRTEVRITNSAELRELIDANLLDIALYVGRQEDQHTVSVAKMVWLGDPELLLQPVLPIAVTSRPCIFRDAAIAALEKLGQPYTIAIETPSLSVLKAAVESGMAVTCRTRTFLDHSIDTLMIDEQRLPDVAYNIAVREKCHPLVETVTELLREAMVGI